MMMTAMIADDECDAQERAEGRRSRAGAVTGRSGRSGRSETSETPETSARGWRRHARRLGRDDTWRVLRCDGRFRWVGYWSRQDAYAWKSHAKLVEPRKGARPPRRWLPAARTHASTARDVQPLPATCRPIRGRFETGRAPLLSNGPCC